MSAVIANAPRDAREAEKRGVLTSSGIATLIRNAGQHGRISPQNFSECSDVLIIGGVCHVVPICAVAWLLMSCPALHAFQT